MRARIWMRMLRKLQQWITRAILRESAKDNKCRVEVLTTIVCQVLGIVKMDWSTRIPRYVWARAFVAYELFEEGLTEEEIGCALMKDHSTVNYLKRKMSDMLNFGGTYGDIPEKWKQFKTEIQ